MMDRVKGFVMCVRMLRQRSWKEKKLRIFFLIPMHLRLLAHNVRSLWNVGSFFRTSDALNVERIYLTGYTGHPPRKEITKTALGAEETVEWEKAVEPLQMLK